MAFSGLIAGGLGQGLAQGGENLLKFKQLQNEQQYREGMLGYRKDALDQRKETTYSALLGRAMEGYKAGVPGFEDPAGWVRAQAGSMKLDPNEAASYALANGAPNSPLDAVAPNGSAGSPGGTAAPLGIGSPGHPTVTPGQNPFAGGSASAGGSGPLAPNPGGTKQGNPFAAPGSGGPQIVTGQNPFSPQSGPVTPPTAMAAAAPAPSSSATVNAGGPVANPFGGGDGTVTPVMTMAPGSGPPLNSPASGGRPDLGVGLQSGSGTPLTGQGMPAVIGQPGFFATNHPDDKDASAYDDAAGSIRSGLAQGTSDLARATAAWQAARDKYEASPNGFGSAQRAQEFAKAQASLQGAEKEYNDAQTRSDSFLSTVNQRYPYDSTKQSTEQRALADQRTKESDYIAGLPEGKQAVGFALVRRNDPGFTGWEPGGQTSTAVPGKTVQTPRYGPEMQDILGAAGAQGNPFAPAGQTGGNPFLSKLAQETVSTTTPGKPAQFNPFYPRSEKDQVDIDKGRTEVASKIPDAALSAAKAIGSSSDQAGQWALQRAMWPQGYGAFPLPQPQGNVRYPTTIAEQNDLVDRSLKQFELAKDKQMFPDQLTEQHNRAITSAPGYLNPDSAQFDNLDIRKRESIERNMKTMGAIDSARKQGVDANGLLTVTTVDDFGQHTMKYSESGLNDWYNRLQGDNAHFAGSDGAPSGGGAVASGMVGTDFGKEGCARAVLAWGRTVGINLPNTQNARTMEQAMPKSGMVQTNDPSKAQVVFMPGSGPSGRHVGLIEGGRSYQADARGPDGNIDTTLQPYPIPRGKGVTYWMRGTASAGGGRGSGAGVTWSDGSPAAGGGSGGQVGGADYSKMTDAQIRAALGGK